jgi:hypothetical protein
LEYCSPLGTNLANMEQRISKSRPDDSIDDGWLWWRNYYTLVNRMDEY